MAKDSHNDNVSFKIDWGDGEIKDYNNDWYWSEVLQKQFKKDIIFTHTYENPGNYVIKAKAKDDWDLSESDWGTLQVQVIIPRNRIVSNIFFKNSFDFFQDMFPILQNLLNRLEQ